MYKKPNTLEADSLDELTDFEKGSRLACQMSLTKGCNNKTFVLMTETSGGT